MDYIEIEGYKSIRKSRVDLGPINILIGANGSGKSNFLSFFDFLNVLYRRSLSEYVALKGADKLLHKGPSVTNTISFRVEFGNGTNGYKVRLQLGDNGFIVLEERLIYDGNENADISRNEREARLFITDNFRSKYVKKYLNKVRKYHFHDTGIRSSFAKTSNIYNDKHFLYENGENLAAYLFDIKARKPKNYLRIVDTIQSIAPFFHDFYLEPNLEGNIRLQWQDKYSSATYGVTDFSDGTIRFIAIATLFLQPNLPDTIVIDEPELGLHPFAIAKLAGMIQAAASKECQVIVATQSAELIGYFNPEDIIAVDLKNGETQFERLDAEKYAMWLEEYTLDELWKRNIISYGQPNY